MGRVLLLSRAPFVHEEGVLTPQNEKERFENALLLASGKMKALLEKLDREDEAYKILEAQNMLLFDEETKGEIELLIEEGLPACEAVKRTAERYIDAFRLSEDESLKRRAKDIEDIALLVSEALKAGNEVKETKRPQCEPFVLVTNELSPAELTEYMCDDLKGIVVSEGSYLSHTAIIARSHGIPMILLDGTDLCDCNGLDAIVDANAGHFFTEPDFDLSAFYRRRIGNTAVPVRKPKEEFKDGIRVYANITGLSDAKRAKEENAPGIGLFRTEFLYMGRKEPPSEEESLEEYTQVLSLFQDGPVTVRTFDLGGDKEAEYLKDREELAGLRGIKLAIREQDLLITQFRALLRANIYGNLRVMIPFVSGKTDLLNSKALIRAAKRSLERDGLLYRDFPLGIMVETASAVQVIDELAGLSKFFSIGTNDLRFDLFGKDRFKDKLTWEEQTGERLTEVIKEIAAAARRAEITVGICGETDGLDTDSLGIDYISR